MVREATMRSTAREKASAAHRYVSLDHEDAPPADRHGGEQLVGGIGQT